MRKFKSLLIAFPILLLLGMFCTVEADIVVESTSPEEPINIKYRTDPTKAWVSIQSSVGEFTYEEGLELLFHIPESEIIVTLKDTETEGTFTRTYVLRSFEKIGAGYFEQVSDTEIRWWPPTDQTLTDEKAVKGVWRPKPGPGTGGRPLPTVTRFGEVDYLNLNVAIDNPDEFRYVPKGEDIVVKAKVVDGNGEGYSGKKVYFRLRTDTEVVVDWQEKSTGGSPPLATHAFSTAELEPDNYTVVAMIKKPTAEGYEHEEKALADCTVFVVEIEEIWSDQLANISSGTKANYHPKGSGKEDNNYLMIAPVSPNGHLKMRTKLKIEPNVPAMREKVLLRLKNQNGALKGESYLPKYDTTTIADVWLSSIGWALVSEGNIVVGVDRDGNGILEIEEVIDTYEDAKFVLVKPAAYSSSYVWLKGYTAGWPLYPYAAHFLNSFLENQPVPVCSYVQSVLIPRNEPSHNVGAHFEGSGPQAKAPVNNNIFDENNALSYIITEHDHFRNLLIGDVLFVNWKQVRDTFRDDENIQSKWFVWPWLDEEFTYPGGDMYYAFGKVEIAATVKVLVQREGMEVTMVKVEGEQTDLYDWLYTRGPAMDAAGAKVQTGFLTLGDKGRIFKSKVLFDHFLDVNYNYMWVWETE